MKQFYSLLLLAFLLCTSGVFTSCVGDEETLQEVEIDIDYLYGTWKNKTNDDHWKYNHDGTGVYWDASETTEAQASSGNKSGLFQWDITETGLLRFLWDEEMQQFFLKAGDDPSVIEELTATSMTYRTSSGKRQYFTKIR